MHLYRLRLHLQWGFTLIMEAAVIQASILFKDTLQSLKVLTHWVKLSREDKKVSSSQEVTAARFSTPCMLLEKCHNCQLKEKWLGCYLLLMTGPYKRNYINLLEGISSYFPCISFPASTPPQFLLSKHYLEVDPQKTAMKNLNLKQLNTSMEVWLA